MPYQANVINVMIASPGDVAAERSSIQETIHRWNSINAEERRTVLMPIMWETHATPEMGDRPQAIINRQVLENCDLLVGVFWTRIGTPTGSSPSGTVEEIHKHLEAGRPVLLYFSQKPVALDSVDLDQYAALKEFREECKRAGLIATYDSLEEFAGQFDRHLSQTVRDRFTGTARGGEQGEPALITPARPPISSAARIVLAAAADAGGEILRIPMLGGTSIRAGARNFDTGDPRQLARWEAAIRELDNQGLIESMGHKNELFRVTHEGYELADSFGGEDSSTTEG
jgi:hypothetical protein